MFTNSSNGARFVSLLTGETSLIDFTEEQIEPFASDDYPEGQDSGVYCRAQMAPGAVTWID